MRSAKSAEPLTRNNTNDSQYTTITITHNNYNTTTTTTITTQRLHNHNYHTQNYNYHTQNYNSQSHTKLQHTITTGTGTFGRVKLCKHKESKEFYALKILRKHDIIRLKQVEHILNEKNVLAQIDFPFIVKLYKTFQDDTNLYMIMEYVVGGELFSHLRKVGKFPNDVRCKVRCVNEM